MTIKIIIEEYYNLICEMNYLLILSNGTLEDSENIQFIMEKVLINDDFKNINDINEFINERMVYFAQNKSFDKAKEENDFKQLFTLLASLNIHPFAKYIEGKKAFMGMFLISTYEVIAIGLGSFIDKYSSADSTCIIDKIKTMWSDEEFLRASGTGKSAKTRMAQCIGIGLRMFKK